jgi:hypothetical protein
MVRGEAAATPSTSSQSSPVIPAKAGIHNATPVPTDCHPERTQDLGPGREKQTPLLHTSPFTLPLTLPLTLHPSHFGCRLPASGGGIHVGAHHDAPLGRGKPPRPP